MNGVVWDAYVDAYPKPMIDVVAVGWYEARAIAAARLNIAIDRIHVAQRRTKAAP